MKYTYLVIAFFLGFYGYSQCSVVANGSALDCSGSNGEIIIIPTGTSPYQYSIDNGVTFVTDSIFDGLDGGTYSVVITDGNNCTSQVDVDVPGIVSVYVLNSVEDCTNQSGHFDIIADGGTGVYEYSIDNGITYMTASSYGDLTGGDYNIVVKDSDGCEASIDETVEYPLAIDNVTVIPSCSGQNTGHITVTAIDGVGNYSYSFNGGGNFNNINTASNVSPGDFEIIIQDNFGCTVDTTVTVDGNPEIIPTLTSAPVSCDGVTLGSVNVTLANPGTYDFSIDGGTTITTGSDYSNLTLTSGNYILQIEDQFGCEEIVSFFIDKQEIKDSIIKQNEFCYSENGEISIIAYVGEIPFEYSIDNGATFLPSGNFSNLAEGTYIAHAKDAIGCIKIDTVEITNFGGIDAIPSENDTICKGSSSIISVTHNGGTGVSYLWDNNLPTTRNNTVSPINTTSYTVIVTDVFDCKDTVTATVVVEENPEIVLSQTQILACIGDSVQILASGADEYSWNTGEVTENLDIVVDGVTTYTVTGNIGGCFGQESVNVIIKPIPLASAQANKTSINTHDSIFFKSVGSVGSDYSWDFKDGHNSTLSNPNHKFDFAGAYQVQLTVKMGGCEATDSILVYVGTVSISENSGIEVLAYPNPAKDEVTIEVNEYSQLELFSISGKLITQRELLEGKNQISLASFSKGIYLAMVKSSSNYYEFKLVIN